MSILARDTEETWAQMEGRMLHGDQVRDDINTTRHLEPEEEEAGRLLTASASLDPELQSSKSGAAAQTWSLIPSFVGPGISQAQ